jgi:thiamine biosynthesis protein ThiI
VKPELIIVRYSEIGLKANFTRKTFENILQKNIKDVLKKENIIFNLDKTRGRFFIYTEEIKKTTNVLQKIFAIKSISPCFKTDSNIDSMKNLVLKVIEDKINKDTSFALRVKREGNHEYTSQDVAIRLGDEIVKKTNAKVNLSIPDITLFIEIRQGNAFFFFEKIAGPGGLPFGSQGTVLSLIQSKDNKFLATWYMMRRGCIPVFLTLEKEFIENIKTFTNKWYFNAEVVECNKNTFCETIEKVIFECGCEAIITDHCLTDDFSEMLKEITKLKKGVNVPLLQPLIAMDKKFIEEKSKEIDL